MPRAVYYTPESRMRFYCCFDCGEWSYRALDVERHEQQHMTELAVGERCRLCGKTLHAFNSTGLCRDCLNGEENIGICHRCKRHYPLGPNAHPRFSLCPKCGKERDAIAPGLAWLSRMTGARTT